MRKESDSIGDKEIPADALYGIHSARARENFPESTSFPLEWYKAVGLVKQACYITYREFKRSALAKYPGDQLTLSFFGDEVIDSLIDISSEVSQGRFFEDFIIPAISGGAGTSINMNVNEIIANASLKKLGHKPGDYKFIDPIEQANVFQSTNDVIPTSLKVALMFLFRDLEKMINDLRMKVEHHENENRNN